MVFKRRPGALQHSRRLQQAETRSRQLRFRNVVVRHQIQQRRVKREVERSQSSGTSVGLGFQLDGEAQQNARLADWVPSQIQEGKQPTCVQLNTPAWRQRRWCDVKWNRKVWRELRVREGKRLPKVCPTRSHRNVFLIDGFLSSDSDRTDCVSDLGQEAGDECDTDDLLDVEYIDKSSRQEAEKAAEKKKQAKSKASKKSQENQPKKRKKMLRKRNKNSECRSPVTSNRGCRSVGGTPVSIRRNEKAAERRYLEPLLSNRSNSLTFSEVHLIHSRMLSISESEKALIKADLEADVKYRQLIHEAESILISMKSNVTAKEVTATVISSPRRVCNVPTNKRVEMLRNCEVDLKRELSKTANTSKFVDAPPTNAHSIINKRLEMLRYETSMSAPSSPKTNRVAPIKTHVTNFIYQNEMELVQRREPSSKIMPKSPAPLRRRFLTPKQDADSDSESDNKSSQSRASGKENCFKHISRIRVELEPTKSNPPMISFRSVVCNNAEAEDLFFPQSEPLKRKIYSCNSTIDKIQRSLDFDSGEAIKYSRWVRVWVIKFRVCLSELPKKALLQKIQMLRQERQAGKFRDDAATEHAELANTSSTADSSKPLVDENIKRKLIMKTIEDIKRSLEDQSLELNELHDSDN